MHPITAELGAELALWGEASAEVEEGEAWVALAGGDEVVVEP